MAPEKIGIPSPREFSLGILRGSGVFKGTVSLAVLHFFPVETCKVLVIILKIVQLPNSRWSQEVVVYTMEKQ